MIYHQSEQINFFGATLLIAMQEFQACEYWVIEAGIGGTNSMTNLLKPSVVCSAVTSIGWDHMDVLGNSLEAILRDKLGVWKENTKIVIGGGISKELLMRANGS